MNWLQKVAQLRDEVFIDDSGFVYGADGDMGPDNHDTTVLHTVLGVLDDYEELTSLDPFDLTPEQMQVVEANYPGFMEFGGQPRDYAVERMGWIRVHGSNFQIGRLDEEILHRIANFASEETNNSDQNIDIEESRTGELTSMALGELCNSLDSGQGLMFIAMKKRRSGLNLY